MRPERFSVIQLACSDGNPEISTAGKLVLEKPVDLTPVAPMFQRWKIELRGEFTQFEGELAEGERCDRRKRAEGRVE